jgi:molecular chaperone GrpE (heat shock protein)
LEKKKMSDKKELSELEKLRVLIPHWLEHSHSHQHEFEKWEAVAKNEGQAAAAEAIEKALQKLVKADKYLRKALEALGGAVAGPHEHHHHG